MELSLLKESKMKFAEPIVMYKKIYSNDNLFKSFMLSFCLHVSIIYIAFYFSYSEKAKPILLNAQEKTISISFANLDLTSPKQVQAKERTQTFHKPSSKSVKPLNKMIEPTTLTQKIASKSIEQTPQKMEPLEKQTVLSSEAFTPQKTSSAEQNTKAPIVQTHTSINMNSPSLSKLPPKKAQQFDISKEQLARIRTMIENALCYPAIAKKLRLEGVVLVSFSLRPDGYVQNIQVVSSSGSSVLDKKAIQTVASLDGEYPHLEEKVDLTLPISFSLNKS